MTDPDQLPALNAPAPTSATSNTSARKQSLQSPLQPREGHVTPGHYRVRVAEKNLPEGTRVRVSQCVDGKVWLYRHSHSWTTPEAHFTENFEHAPDGESAYQGELQAIGEQIALASSKLQQAAAEAAALQPEMHGRVLTGTGEEDETLDRTFRAPDAPPRTVGSELVPAPKSAALTGLRGRTLALQQLQKELEASLKSSGDALRQALDEQISAAMSLIKPLQKRLELIRDGVFTLELYLGEREKVQLLRDGEPAPQDTPITLRQLVLRMDQEAAIEKDGGIDHRSSGDFYHWLLEDPAHLDQVLPEPKGVVALIPRDGEKNSDPWSEGSGRKENAMTHLLVRNGELLFQLTLDFEIGERLIPRRREFEAALTDHGGRLEPGSWKYQEAMERADSTRRHFLKTALLLQGLIDRSTLLRPLPGGRQELPLSDPATYAAGFVEIVADGDEALEEGRERFKDWQKRVNADLKVGARITGHFGYEFNSRHRDDRRGGNTRLTPAHASSPDSFTPYTIEEKRAGMLIIRYDRTDTVYRRGWNERSGEALIRASCQIDPRDRNILAFDHPDVTEDTLERFIRSRTERVHYLTLVPLLKAVRETKRREAQEEAPLRALLLHAVQTLHPVDEAQAETLTVQAIADYKWNVRYSRPLRGEAPDGQVFRALLSRVRALHQAGLTGDDAGTAKLLALHPDALSVIQTGTKAWRVLTPEDDGNVFVRQLDYLRKQAGLTASKDVRWTLPGTVRAGWTVRHTAERYGGWNLAAERSAVLSGPEQQEVRRVAQEKRDQVWQTPKRKYYFGRRTQPRCTGTPFAAPHWCAETLEGHEMISYLILAPGDDENSPVLGAVSARWSKTGGTLKVTVSDTIDTHNMTVRKTLTDELVWPWQNHRHWNEADRRAAPTLNPGVTMLLAQDDHATRTVLRNLDTMRLRRETWQTLDREAETLGKAFRNAHQRTIDAAAFERFMTTYGNADLWEAHRKSRPPAASPLHYTLKALLVHLLQNGQAANALITQTPAQLLALVREQGNEQQLAEWAEAVTKLGVSDLHAATGTA